MDASVHGLVKMLEIWIFQNVHLTIIFAKQIARLAQTLQQFVDWQIHAQRFA